MRQFSRITCGALVLLTTVTAASACVDSRRRLYVRVGPPEPIYETRYVAPGPGYVWIDGYQRWDGNRYGWEQGRWVVSPRPRQRWESGHWERDRHGWYYVEGRWR